MWYIYVAMYVLYATVGDPFNCIVTAPTNYLCLGELDGNHCPADPCKRQLSIVRSLFVTRGCDDSFRCNKRVIGEIASQLERRIVGYVFPGYHRNNMYGFAVRNIDDGIDEACHDAVTGATDWPRKLKLMTRWNYIQTSLTPFGYDFHFHPTFSIDMVSKH